MKGKIKILTVVGARPNLIKIAPLFWEFKKHLKIKAILVHTGQHYDYEMSQVFFEDLDIPKPNYNLGVGSGSHATQTAQAMIELEKVFKKEKPNWVVVVGDVNSTLAAAIVAVKLHLPVAHLEAGPRMFDKSIPEEVNRILTDHLADMNFCPTKSSARNLKKEGIGESAYFTGDTMYEAFLHLRKAVRKKEANVLEKFSLSPKKYILLTLHRPANVDNALKFKDIMEKIIKTRENIIFPIHPRTKKQLKGIIDDLRQLNDFKNIHFIDPISYTEFVVLEKNAKKICTDSGGVQKEAYWLKVPCITILDSQGWPELHKDGWNLLVGSDTKKIFTGIRNFNPKKPQRKHFGDGTAARKMVFFLSRNF